MEMSIHVREMGEVLYPLITCLVNLVNAYDKQELIPEMVELAKFAKHHIPEQHEYDDPDFVEKRVEVISPIILIVVVCSNRNLVVVALCRPL